MDTQGLESLRAELLAARPPLDEIIEGLEHVLEQQDLLPEFRSEVQALLDDSRRRVGLMQAVAWLANRKQGMTPLLDPSGHHIPDDCGVPFFCADLCDWRDGEGPWLTINVPEYFKPWDDEDDIYEGEGVVCAPIKKILEQYLLDFKEIDGGEGIPAFTEWLLDYVERLRKMKASPGVP